MNRAALIGVGVVVCIVIGLRVSDEMTRRRHEAFPAQEPLLDAPSASNFSPIRAVPRPPLVTGFRTLDAASASKIIEGDELVLAVEVNGEARAYPINILTGPDREIINDEVGGRPIAATW